MRSAVERPVSTATANATLEELSLRAGRAEPLHRRCIDFTVVVVGRSELDDHVPLRLVIANARYVTSFLHIRACGSVKRHSAVVLNLDSFCRGNLAHPEGRAKNEKSQDELHSVVNTRPKLCGRSPGRNSAYLRVSAQALRRLHLTFRVSDRAVLSSAEYLGIWFRRTERLGAVHASLSSRSRPEGRRCTHWSDGAESHALGRALQRSSHIRLHPDHHLHLNAQSSIPFISQCA